MSAVWVLKGSLLADSDAVRGRADDYVLQMHEDRRVRGTVERRLDIYYHSLLKQIQKNSGDILNPRNAFPVGDGASRGAIIQCPPFSFIAFTRIELIQPEDLILFFRSVKIFKINLWV